MFGIGTTEIVVILIVALLVIGPAKLPELARTLGKGLAEFRRMSSDVKKTVDLESKLSESEEKNKGGESYESKGKPSFGESGEDNGETTSKEPDQSREDSGSEKPDHADQAVEEESKEEDAQERGKGSSA